MAMASTHASLLRPPPSPLFHPAYVSRGCARLAWRRAGAGVVSRHRSSRRQVAASLSSGGPPRSAEQALRATIEMDKLIDTLLSTDTPQMPQAIAENIFAFDQNFWLRLATRADSCASAADRADLEELSRTVMTIVERLVRQTEESMDSTSDRLAELLVAAGLVGASSKAEDEVMWPPRDPGTLQRLREELKRRDAQGDLDDSLLASLTAQLRQAQEAQDKPGLVTMLQKVLQTYAATRFATRSFAAKSGGEIDAAEQLLESLLEGDVERWEVELQKGLKLGGGEVSEDDFFRALDLRSKRMLMRTENGSYEQRILGEYLAELETRAKNLVEAFSRT